MEKILSIAVPTYNRRVLLKRVLDSISVQVNDEIEVLVSDNASNDGTEDMIREYYPWVAYYRNENNVGPDRNFLNCYIKSRGKYVWLVGSDDIVESGSIEIIINSIKNYNNNLIFLNHSFFKNGKRIMSSHFINRVEGYACYERFEFINIAKQQLTYMSSFILKKSSFEQVKNPKKYYGTNFIHTCIALEATQNDNSFGVLYNSCIMQDLTTDNSEFNVNLDKSFEVFGRWMHWTLCDCAVKYGFPLRQMKTIYRESVYRYLIINILKMNSRNISCEKKSFFKNVYPVIKKDIILFILVMPFYLIPSRVAKCVLRLKYMAKL